MNEEVVIDHIGASGDGVAKTNHGAVYVPFTLPSEVANIAVIDNRGTVMALKKTSSERIDPACHHFEDCGGCSLQHWQDDAYQAWKRALVVDTLKGRGIETNVAPLVPCLPQTRRRITLTARVTTKGQIIGFNRFQSHDIVAIEECPVACSEIVEKFADIRAICAVLANHAKLFHITVTSVENGFDVAITGCTMPEDKLRQKLVLEALKRSITRLSIEGEIVVEQAKPLIHFGRIEVQLTAGGFLQATREAENCMSEIVLKGLKKVKNACDLFSGSGSFTFRMAEKMNVHVVESDGDALASLDRAMREATGLKTITHEKRDLFRRPLTVKELEQFDGLVFDPPRAGAEGQVREIAKSTLSRIVAVSCNPVTLARDLSILIDGGYHLESVTPIDQFLWSSHVETVAVLTKRKPKPGWRL